MSQRRKYLLKLIVYWQAL